MSSSTSNPESDANVPLPASRLLSTPMKYSSSQTGSFISSDLSSAPTRSQDVLKAVMRKELHGSTFESATVASVLGCPSIDANIISKAREILSNKGWDHNYAWPTYNKEVYFYEPFASALNQTMSAAMDAFEEKGRKRYYENLRFSVYDRQTSDRISGASPLKPDIVGCDRIIPQGETVSWGKDIMIPVEVKNTWPDLVSQASTYARCVYASSNHRRFVLVIAFNHNSCGVRFLFFHRSGLIATKEADLRKDEGWEQFVDMVVRVASWEDANDAGMDSSSDNFAFQLPYFGRCEIAEHICDRICVSGRGTQVYRVTTSQVRPDPAMKELSKDTPVDQPPRPIYKYQTRQNKDRGSSIVSHIAKSVSATTSETVPTDQPNFRPYPLRASRSSTSTPHKKKFNQLLPPEIIQPMQQPLPEESIDQSLHSDVIQPMLEPPIVSKLVSHEKITISVDSPIPPSLIIKESWSTRQNEVEMFKHVRGLFGVPDVYATYNVMGPNGLHETNRLTPTEYEYWNVFGTQKTDYQPENRIHTRVIFKTEGRHLSTAESPYELVEGILHSMLGYLNLYQMGWMHRDVSEGNIMLTVTRKEDKNPFGSDPKFIKFVEKFHLTNCTGMIIDGDHAIEWRKNDRQRGTHRSGTLPFISSRLVRAWIYDQQYEHTAVDDLESFYWVLLWFIFLFTEKNNSLNQDDRMHFDMLQSHDLGKHTTKEAIPIHIKNEMRSGDATPLVTMLYPLLSEWNQIIDEARWKLPALLKNVGTSEKQHEEVTFDFFGQCLTAGFKHLANLKGSWDDVFKVV